MGLLVIIHSTEPPCQPPLLGRVHMRMVISCSVWKYGYVDIIVTVLWFCNKCVLKALVMTWSAFCF